ncbi:MAG TPA: glycosyltransferase [bacterium]
MPPISIIVAGRNEERYVGGCLRSLLQLDYDPQLTELIFVDDHSTDGTRALAEGLAVESGGRLRVLSAPPCPAGMGPKKNAIAFGVAQAKGELLLFTDADCLVKPGWATCAVSSYRQKTGAATGPVLPPVEAGFVNRLLRLERILISYTSASAIGWGSPASASGGNFSYRRAAFDSVGGIAHAQVASGDDDLMAQAIARHGWQVGYARGAESVVEHLRRPTMGQQVNATIRHQSTTRYYPLHWRLIYILSILSTLGLLAVLAATVFVPELLGFLLAAMTGRLLIEGIAVRAFCRCYEIRLSTLEFLTAEICLPVYLLIRAVLSLFPSFSWQARTHRTTTAPTTGAV